MPENRNVYTVGQVNKYVKNMFANDYMLHRIYVKGEASNVKYHASGHIYFTMKDETGSIACVMFAGNRKGLNFKLRDGQQIVTLGSVEVYERDGKYQIYAKEIILDGAGFLYERYEKLKRELEEMGMFDKEYKKPIPKYAKRIGIVTADTGAAIQDIINIATRRNPYVQLILYPALVQGDGAAASIVRGISVLETKNVDVIIVGRGGGSIEDLWAFNEEAVARAIFACSVPIVSAVGHETDTTISDYVADLRAPTPSAAAELTVFKYDEYVDLIKNYASVLDVTMHDCIAHKRNELQTYNLKLRAVSPMAKISEKRMYGISLQDKLDELIKRAVVYKRHQLQLYASKLEAMSPLKRLRNGFALVDNETGVIDEAKDVKPGDDIILHMLDGDVGCTVNTVKLINRKELFDE